MVKAKPELGILFAFISLGMLGLMPVLSNARPSSLDALNFALYLSLWQLIFSLPLIFYELYVGKVGIFAAGLCKPLRKRTIIIIMLTGIIFGLSTYVYVLSVEKAGTVSAAIAMQAYPLFAILWETVFLGRRKSRLELAFTTLLMLTLYYLGTAGSWRIEGISGWFLLAILVPFLWSVAHVLIKEVLVRTPISPAQVTFFRVLVSSMVLLMIAVYSNGTSSIIDGFSNNAFQMAALVMGLVYYLELVVWFYAVRHIDVSVASSITTPWPVLTMILAAVFLQESIANYQILAMVLVAISVYGLLYAGKLKAAQNSKQHF